MYMNLQDTQNLTTIEVDLCEKLQPLDRKMKKGEGVQKKYALSGCMRGNVSSNTFKARQVINEETSTSSSCPLPLSILNSIPHVMMRTISDEEARKAKSKVHRLQNGASSDMQKKPFQAENTGRWTKEEHAIFLQGLEKHGKEWKEISHMIPTRSVVQIRTHAQKYFQKVAKTRAKEGKLDTSSGELDRIVSTASTSSSSSKCKKIKICIRRSSKERIKNIDLANRQKYRPRCSSPKRRKKSQKLNPNTPVVDDLEPIPLIIKTPTSSLCKRIPPSFIDDDFDDEMIGTPKSVAELFTSDIASKYQKQGSTDLAFLDEDIEHFDFDGNSTGYANVGSIAFDTMEFGSEYVSAVPRKTLTRTSNTETFVGFSDLEIDLGKAAFIVDDIVHSSDPSFSQGGLKSDKLKKTWLRESCTAVNEEEFISGLLV